jgi:hypothetical protein
MIDSFELKEAFKFFENYVVHCIPGEAYMRLITASSEAGPGATPMCTFEVCMRRILILDLLTDVSFEILHSACESGICTLN